MIRFSLSILVLVLSSGIAGAQLFVNPIEEARVAQPYAAYGKFRPGKYHTGMDILRHGINPYLQRTEQVKAATSGTVHKIFGIKGLAKNLREWDSSTNTYSWIKAPNPGSNHGFGICVIIYHANLNLYTLCGHLDAVVKGLTVGDSVVEGQVIGLLGNSSQQFLRRCPSGDSHDHQTLCVDTAPDAPHGTIVRSSEGIVPHLHFEVKDRGVLSAGRSDDCDPLAGCYWGYTPGPDPSTPNMPGHPNWFGYHDPNLFLNVTVNLLTHPVPIEVVHFQLLVYDYPSTNNHLSLTITQIAQRSDGNLPAFVAMRSVGTEWYQIYLPSARKEGWSAAGWIPGTIDSIHKHNTSPSQSNKHGSASQETAPIRK